MDVYSHTQNDHTCEVVALTIFNGELNKEDCVYGDFVRKFVEALCIKCKVWKVV